MKVLSIMVSFAMLFSNVGMKASNLVEVVRKDFSAAVTIPGWDHEDGSNIDLVGNNRVLVVGAGSRVSTQFNVSAPNAQIIIEVQREGTEDVIAHLKGENTTSHQLLDGMNTLDVSESSGDLVLELVNDSSKDIVIKSVTSANVSILNGEFKESLVIPGFVVAGEHILIKNGVLELHDINANGNTTVRSTRIAVDGSKDHRLSVDLEVINQSHSVEIGVNYLDKDGKVLKYSNVLMKDRKGLGRFTENLELPSIPGTESINVSFNSGKISITEAHFFGISVFEYQEVVEEDIYDTLLNPGFEEGLKHWHTVAANEPFTTSKDVVKSGLQSLYLQDLVSEGANDTARILSNKVKVEPNKNYLLSAEVNVETQSHSIVMVTEYYDANNVLLKNFEELFSSNTLGTNKWNTIRKMSNAPERAAYVRVGFYSGKPSVTKAYFDDVTLTPINNSQDLDRDYSDPINLGSMVDVGLGQAGAIGKNALGEMEVYFLSNGSPGTFYALDAHTGAVKFSEVIPNTIAIWAITIGKDKNVYFGGTEDGRMYRYLPETQTIEDLGANPADKWIWDLEVADNGKLYGTTYPNAKLFEFDPSTKEFKDLGRMHPTQQYARGLGIDGDSIYVGIGTVSKHLKKHTISTGVTEELTIEGFSGSAGTFEDITIIGDYLFVSNGTINMLVIDKHTLEVVGKFQYSNRIGYDAAYDADHVYYKFQKNLFKFNINTLKQTKIDLERDLPDTVRTKDVQWMMHEGVAKIALITQYGEYMLIEPTSGKVDMIILDISLQPVDIQSLELGFDGRLYMGGYQRGLSIYNPFTDTIDENLPNFAQPEGIGFLNDRVWYGTYVGAIMYSFDPTKDLDVNSNPNFEYKITDNQDRPFALTSGDNKLFVGTVPDYGMLGGVLAIYDEPTDTWTQHRNVVADQSIISLAYKDGFLYGGTSVWGGLGIDPTAKEAEMFIWDVEKDELVKSFTLDIPGIDEDPRMIGELKFDDNGLLWGVVDGTIFAFDTESETIVKSKMIEPSKYNSSKWFPYRLQFAPDGMIYTTIGRKLVAVDPESLDHKVLVDEFMNNMTLGFDGSIYYAKKSELYKIEVSETDATLKDIQLDGVSIEGFSSGTLNYTLHVDMDQGSALKIEAFATQSGATVTVDTVGNVSTIRVVGEDGVSTLTYTVTLVEKMDPVDPVDPVDPFAPVEPVDPVNPPKVDKDEILPGTGVNQNFTGVMAVGLGAVLLIMFKRRQEKV